MEFCSNEQFKNFLLELVCHQFKETKHYAIFFPRKTKSIHNRVVMGECNTPGVAGLPSVHAEHAAIMKLLKYKNRPQNLDLLVIRFSKRGKLGASRPCYHCLKRLENIVEKHNVNICSIFYSTENGDIDEESLQNMRFSHKTYKSAGFREKSFE
jgi:cytidine deaminase